MVRLVEFAVKQINDAHAFQFQYGAIGSEREYDKGIIKI